MKRLIVAIAVLSLAVSAHAKDTVKLNFSQVQDVAKALGQLDGSTRLDKDNAPVQIAFELKGSVRLAIARDMQAMEDSYQTYVKSWQQFLKGAGITDEAKETDAQKKAIAELLNTPMEVEVVMLKEADLVSPDNDHNPIPPTVIARLLPLIKS